MAVVAVPPAPGRVRIITPTITTRRYDAAGAVIEARYVDTREYESPHEAQLFTRMVPLGCGKRGKWGGRWRGEVQFQTFEPTETAALSDLLDALDRHELPYDTERARAILVALACATQSTPWELRPMGARSGKPRKPRYTWQINGKRVMIHKDTLRAHKDPTCQCPHCTMVVTPTTIKNETKP